MNAKHIIILLFFPLLMLSCNEKTGRAEERETNEQKEADMTPVVLTERQVQQLKISVGTVPEHSFASYVEVNGKIAADPQSEAAITPFIGANVKRLLVREGQVVRSGQAVAILSHPDLLELQSRYYAARSRMSYVAKEYERQKALMNDKIGAGKDLQQIRAEYRGLQAEINTTAARLRLLGIRPETLTNGRTVSSIVVRSPINGTVEQINVQTGRYVDPQTPMMNVVNNDHLFAKLLVYEKDVSRVKSGQNVRLLLPAVPGRRIDGKVRSVGKTFAQDSKAISVRVSLDGNVAGVIAGMYVRGRIASDEQKRNAVREDGIVDEGGKSYVFTAEKKNTQWIFTPVEVSKGKTEDGFVELTGGLTLTRPIALNGAYYLISEMKKSETGED